MKNKVIIFAARLLSNLFRPFYMPLLGFLVLFAFTYLRLLPGVYKLTVLLMVYCFTILLPQLTIWFYRKMNGWKKHQLRHRENRMVPYMLFILCYLGCLYLLLQLHLPRYLGGIIVASLLVQMVCAVVNLWWKVSSHSAGAGGVIGVLLAFSQLFYFNPLWWLCLCILISGLVNSSRMVLRQHTLGQVMVGTLIGVLCGFVGIMIA